MISLSYTVTPDLRETLSAIDQLRRVILTTPLSPKNELGLRWQTTVDHIHASLALANRETTKQIIMEILTRSPKRKTEEIVNITYYKGALDWIAQNWSANPKLVALSTVASLMSLALPESPAHLGKTLARLEPAAKQLFAYLHSKEDHPVVTASIAQAYFLTNPLSESDNGRLARLFWTLICTKHGYDIRSMICPERIWYEGRESYRRAFDSIGRLGQLTSWLEYCAKTTLVALSELKDAVEAATRGLLRSETPASFWELNDRQKAILTLLENPTAKITNRETTKRFKVSQITASRDLAKLAVLGLLYSHGKGRSVYYTRV